VGELRERVVDDDRAVHLRELVEELWRERLVERDAAGEQERELRRIADHDQRAFVGADDVVDPLAQVCAGRDSRDGVEQLGLATRIALGGRAREPQAGRGVVLTPGVSLRHRVLP
jgi:hypothetical protein